MAALKTRNPQAVGQRSGGQESEALMSYLAMVKDQCKPPVYSAFISLINAYHGNMLAVDALLSELFALFSPRVFLLSGIKPLVDKSYHPRIDELCDKVSRSRSSNSSSSGDGGSDGGGISGDISLPPSLECTSDTSDRSVAFRGAMDVHAATTKPELGGGGGGGGNHARLGGSKSGSTPSLSSVDSGGKDKGQSIRVGIEAGGSTGSKRNPSSVTSTSKSSSSRRKAGGSCSTGGGRRDNGQELGAKPTLGSPNTGALHSDKGDIGELLSDIEPTVDPALLDFMMRDNSPAVASPAVQMNPPSLTLHQEQQQQQHHWSPPSTTLDQALLGSTDHTLPSARLSPTKRIGGTEESSVELLSTEKHIPPTCHRSGSASSLTELAGRGEGGARAMGKSSGPLQNRQRCSVALSASPSSRTSPTVTCGSSVSVGRQGPVGGPGISTPNGSENLSLEDEVFPGSGKRVWDERGEGSGVGTSRMARLSSSAPPDSFYFPSAAAATAGNEIAASRPHIKRRISTDAAANGIEEDHSPVQRNGASDAAFSSGGGSSGGSIDNDRGSGGSNGEGLNAFGSLNSEPMNSDIARVGSVRSMSLRQESPLSSRGEGGLSKSGSDLERLVMNVATKGMQQALQYGLRHTFSVILLKKDREIAELKEEALRWAENDTRLRQLNQQLLNDNMQLRAAAGWETHPSSKSP